jgi:hypothetical protein
MINPKCSPLMPYGMNGSCAVPLAELKIPIITDRNVEFESLSDVWNIVKWKDLVQVDLTAYSPLGITSYDPTTDDVNIVTAESTGKKTITNTPIPSAIVYLDTNSCDFSELINNLRGGSYGIIYVLKGGSIIMDYEDGKYKPLLANLTAITKGIPLKETYNNFPMYINHVDYDSFARAKVISMPFNVATVMTKAMPAGANIEIITPYAIGTGIVRVSLNNRCEAVKITDAIVTDFEIIASNDLISPAVTTSTPVAGVDGQYDLVIDKEVIPEPLEEGDFATLVYKKKTATIVNRISQRLDIFALN